MIIIRLFKLITVVFVIVLVCPFYLGLKETKQEIKEVWADFKDELF